jgi:hypothetical protein
MPMSGPRISVVVHDGSRILDRKRIGQEAKDQTAMEITKSFYQTEVKTYKGLGDEVVAIGDLKKGKDQGFQLYLAIEVQGKVVEMGLPFIKNNSGEDLFLNPSNIKPGDLESIAPNLPAGAEILMVWRLDKGMDQDIVVRNDSIISSISPPPVLGADYSMLDKKACISCGGGASSKFDFVLDVMEVKLFCGGQEDPIRMSTLLVPAPETFLFDANRMPIITRQMEHQQDPRNSMVPGNLADISTRTSWEDCVKIGESFLSSFSIYYNRQVADVQPDGQKAPIQFDAGTTIVLFRIPREKGQAGPPLPILNPSEKRLWLEIHDRKSQPFEAPQTANLQSPRSPSVEAMQILPILGSSPAAIPQVRVRPLHLHLGSVQDIMVPTGQAQPKANPSTKEKKADIGIPISQKATSPPRLTLAHQEPGSLKQGAKEKPERTSKSLDVKLQKPKNKPLTKERVRKERIHPVTKIKTPRSPPLAGSRNKPPKPTVLAGAKNKPASIEAVRKNDEKRVRSNILSTSMPKRQASSTAPKRKAGRVNVHLFNEMMGIHAYSSKRRNPKGKARRG